MLPEYVDLLTWIRELYVNTGKESIYLYEQLSEKYTRIRDEDPNFFSTDPDPTPDPT